MDRFLQAAALAMVGAVLALVVQKQAKEISILMVIACSAVILALAAWFLEPVDPGQNGPAVRQCSGLVPGSAPIYQCARYDWGYAEEVKPCGSG